MKNLYQLKMPQDTLGPIESFGRFYLTGFKLDLRGIVFDFYVTPMSNFTK